MQVELEQYSDIGSSHGAIGTHLSGHLAQSTQTTMVDNAPIIAQITLPKKRNLIEFAILKHFSMNDFDSEQKELTDMLYCMRILTRIP